MKKDQLEKHLQFALEHLNLGFGTINSTNFKLKPYQIQKKPNWPKSIKFFANASLKSL